MLLLLGWWGVRLVGVLIGGRGCPCPGREGRGVLWGALGVCLGDCLGGGGVARLWMIRRTSRYVLSLIVVVRIIVLTIHAGERDVARGLWRHLR